MFRKLNFKRTMKGDDENGVKHQWVREEKGMTQEQLAEKANVNRSLLNQLETGKLKNTSINTLQKIADTLNCKIIELFI